MSIPCMRLAVITQQIAATATSTMAGAARRPLRAPVLRVAVLVSMRPPFIGVSAGEHALELLQARAPAPFLALPLLLAGDVPVDHHHRGRPVRLREGQLDQLAVGRPV